MKKLNISFIGPMLGKHVGRVPNPAEELAPLLAQERYSCRLASSHPNRYVRFLDILLTLFRQRQQTELVSLQVYSGPSFIVEDAASWLAKRLGLRLVMVLHGGAIKEFIARYPRWAKRVFRRADRLVSPSQYLAGELKKVGFNVRVIPNGMDIHHYPFRLRQGQPPRLIWLRAFHPIYQPEMAVQVVQRLVGEFPSISLQMIGPSYGEVSLVQTKHLIASLGLENNVQIAGYVPKVELPAWLQEGEIFLNITRYESFGITVMEAAACGLPVVTTNVGELSLLWQNGHNALTIEVDDVAGMAGAVRRILSDPTLAQQLSQAARQTAEQFGWSRVLPQWEQIFEEVMQK